MEKRKISFLGDLLIIIVIVFFVFLFLNQIKQSNIEKIVIINDKYGLSKQILVPANPNDYTTELFKISEKTITTKFIEFVNLTQDVSTIERLLKRANIVREDCVSRDLKLKINAANITINKLTNDFQMLNSKKFIKLNIESYNLYLKDLKKTYSQYKIELAQIDVCK